MLLPLLFTAATAQGPVMLRFAPPVGTSARYRLVNKSEQKMPAGMPSTNFTSTVDMTVKYVSRKGNLTTVESSTGAMKIDMPATSPLARMKPQMEASGSNKKFQAVIDMTGKLVSSKALGATARLPGGTQGFASSMQGVSFPNRAVKVGETWKSSLDLGKMMRTMGSAAPGMTITGVLPIATKLVGVKQAGGKSLANLQFTMTGTMTMGMQGQNFATRMNTKGTLWVEVGTGVIYETSATNESTTNLGGQQMVQKASTSMKKL